MLACWRALPARDYVPARRDFDPMAIPRVLPVISLLQRSAGGEWLFRVAGTEIERRRGRNFTGLDYLGIDIVSARAAATIRREFELVTEFPCGSWSQRRVRFRSGRHALIETLRLPLRGNDGATSMILSCSEELSDRSVPQTDAACEVITITDQRFHDIGAGSPLGTALAEGEAKS